MLLLANQKPWSQEGGLPMLSPRPPCTVEDAAERAPGSIIVVREQVPVPTVTNIFVTMPSRGSAEDADRPDDDDDDAGSMADRAALPQEPDAGVKPGATPSKSSAVLTAAQESKAPAAPAMPPVIGSPVTSPDGTWEAWSEGWPSRDPGTSRTYPSWLPTGGGEPGPAACHLCRVLLHRRGDTVEPRPLLVLGQDDPFQPWFASVRLVGWSPDSKALLVEIVSGRRGDEETITSLLELDLNGRPHDVLELDTFLAMEEQGLYYGERETQNSEPIGYGTNGSILFETHHSSAGAKDTVERWSVDAARHRVTRVEGAAVVPDTIRVASTPKSEVLLTKNTK